nr:DUF308 domain-containing protein [uncultured Blautia sp.]
MWEKINNFLKGQIVTSIIYIALGACLAFMPVNTINVICKFVFGILLILVGFYHILIYILEKLNSTILDLFSGGVLMVIGIFLFMNPQIVVKLLPILLGTFILVDSIWSLKGSFKLKKRGSGAWKILLIGSLIFIGLGISLVINPFTMVKYTVIFAGWIFLCNGVVDLIYLILLRRGLKELKQEAEAVDADSEIISDDAESSAQPEEPVVPEPEYAPWSSRRKAEPADDLADSEEETSDKETFDSNAYDREVSEMEESLDVVQVREEEVPLGEPTEEMPEQENDPPAGRGAYVVSEPTVTDDDLSDTKDENLLGLISRKRKKNKSE